MATPAAVSAGDPGDFLRVALAWEPKYCVWISGGLKNFCDFNGPGIHPKPFLFGLPEKYRRALWDEMLKELAKRSEETVLKVAREIPEDIVSEVLRELRGKKAS